MLENLPADVVQRNLELLKQIVAETTDEETTRGAFHDIVLYYSAIFATVNQQEIEEVLRFVLIQRLLRAPESASRELVDRVAANRFVERRLGEKARGLVTIVFSKPLSVSIPKKTLFSTGRKQYQTPETYLIHTGTSGVVFENDRVLTPVRGAWQATIPVVATEIGAAFNISRGTTLLADYEIGCKEIYVETDFTGGCDAETNTQLLKRLVKSAAGQIVGSRAGIEACIEKIVPHTQVSIIGMNDPEMTRDQLAPWPGSVGGRVDVYVWPPTTLQTWVIQATGQEVDKEVEIVLPREHAAGIYDVVSIRDTHGTEYPILAEERTYDVKGLPVTIHKNTDALYSAVQVIKLRIQTGKLPKRYAVEVRGVRHLLDLQKALTARNSTNPCADILVKAPIPHTVSMRIVLSTANKDVQHIKDPLRAALCDYINSLGFNKQINRDILYQITDQYVGKSADLQIMGQVQLPGHALVVKDPFTIPNEPEVCVTPRTTVMTCVPNSIEIVCHND
jgi:hypothetical protein